MFPSNRGRRLGVKLDPILGALDRSLKKLQQQVPLYANDPKRSKALQRSIATLQAVRDKTHAICPNELMWFGVPVRRELRRRG